MGDAVLLPPKLCLAISVVVLVLTVTCAFRGATLAPAFMMALPAPPGATVELLKPLAGGEKLLGLKDAAAWAPPAPAPDVVEELMLSGGAVAAALLKLRLEGDAVDRLVFMGNAVAGTVLELEKGAVALKADVVAKVVLLLVQYAVCVTVELAMVLELAGMVVFSHCVGCTYVLVRVVNCVVVREMVVVVSGAGGATPVVTICVTVSTTVTGAGGDDGGCTVSVEVSVDVDVTVCVSVIVAGTHSISWGEGCCGARRDAVTYTVGVDVTTHAGGCAVAVRAKRRKTSTRTVLRGSAARRAALVCMVLGRKVNGGVARNGTTGRTGNGRRCLKKKSRCETREVNKERRKKKAIELDGKREKRPAGRWTTAA